MATANHFWLDVAAGIALALLSATIVVGLESLRRGSAGELERAALQ
jgi:hypothetical protein